MSKKRDTQRERDEQTVGNHHTTTEIVFAPETGDAWERIETRAREDMARHGRLFWAVESMKREQAWTAPKHGEYGEGVQCDHCAHLAAHVWRRTEKELKSMRGRKFKGVSMPANREAFACDVHLPYWRMGVYSPYIQGAAVAA